MCETSPLIITLQSSQKKVSKTKPTVTFGVAARLLARNQN